MPNNDREVFERLTSEPDTEIAQDFLTYAIFAHEKGQWIELFQSRNGGQDPNQVDIDNWISNLTDSQFLSMRQSARTFFVEAAEAFFEARLEAERDSILREAIISEVRSASDWRKQLGMALLTTIAAPLILGGLIALGLFISTLPTPADIARFFHSTPVSSPPAPAPAPATPVTPQVAQPPSSASKP